MLLAVCKVVGVVLALLGSFLVTPDGTRQLGVFIWRQLLKPVRATRVAVMRLLGWTRPVPLATAPESSAPASPSSLRVSFAASLQWNDSAPADERDERLRVFALRLEERLYSVEQRLHVGLTGAERGLHDVATQVERSRLSLLEALDQQGRRTARVNAYALPVIGLGVVLSGIPELLVAWPPLAVLVLVVAVVVSGAAVWLTCLEAGSRGPR
ncbi:MAG: hypothetical protein M3P48_00670 [Actinomycetota bacterium]|nr:hypothetical protein [Actinomycetota bacterium]